MHKYSYQLSEYYRKQPSKSCHYHASQDKYNRNTPYPQMMRNKDKRGDVRAQLSKTMMTNNQPYPMFTRQNKARNEVASKKLQLYKPSNTIATLQSRLANLTNLSDRHSQALKQINRQTKRQQINAYHQQNSPSLVSYANQNNTLKHQFSFNQIPKYQQQNTVIDPIKTQYNQYFQRPSSAKPLESFKVPYQLSKQRLKIRQKAQLHLNMANVNRKTSINQSNIRKQENNRQVLKINKCQSRQTYDKLSSLQDRIKSTIQPYIHI